MNTIANRSKGRSTIIAATIVAVGLVSSALIVKGQTFPGWSSFNAWRMGRQFSSQMQTQLSAISGNRQTQFQRLEMRTVTYHHEGDYYSVYYGVIWKNMKYNFPEEMWGTCTLLKKNGSYSNTCDARIGPLPGGQEGVPIILR